MVTYQLGINKNIYTFNILSKNKQSIATEQMIMTALSG